MNTQIVAFNINYAASASPSKFLIGGTRCYRSGRGGRGRGNNRSRPHNRSRPRVFCQFFQKSYHFALKCNRCFDQTWQGPQQNWMSTLSTPPSHTTPPQTSMTHNSRTYTSSEPSSEATWFIDNSDSHHITSNNQNLA